jgi:hypothetical protein
MSVQKVNTDDGACTAAMWFGELATFCELDAPHPGWAHMAVAGDGTKIFWCSDTEARALK